MCTICGLPSTHANLAQALGTLALASFVATTFLGSWLTLQYFQTKRRLTTGSPEQVRPSDETT